MVFRRRSEDRLFLVMAGNPMDGFRGILDRWRRNLMPAAKADVAKRYASLDWKIERNERTLRSLGRQLDEAEDRLLRAMDANRPPHSAQQQSLVDVLTTFALYQPISNGGARERAMLTTKCINGIFPLLGSFAGLAKRKNLEIGEITILQKGSKDAASSELLKSLFDSYGSDKSNSHDYHLFYGPLLRRRSAIKSVLEVGLGTNNTDIVSHMGSGGKPGASLRAFRDFLPKAKIYGADIDKRILFKEDRIETHFVDQTEPGTWATLQQATPANLDLVIDDGLHAPLANLATLSFGLSKVRRGGWIVIEDVHPPALPFWQVVAALLPDGYECRLLKGRLAYLFVVQRLGEQS